MVLHFTWVVVAVARVVEVHLGLRYRVVLPSSSLVAVATMVVVDLPFQALTASSSYSEVVVVDCPSAFLVVASPIVAYQVASSSYQVASYSCPLAEVVVVAHRSFAYPCHPFAYPYHPLDVPPYDSFDPFLIVVYFSYY